MDLEFKRKMEDGKWHNVPLDECVGKSMRECFEMWDGQEVVVKVRKGFICGTKGWREYYARKGEQVMSFPEAVIALEAKGASATLDHVFIPVAGLQEFSGAEVAQTKIDLLESDLDDRRLQKRS